MAIIADLGSRLDFMIPEKSMMSDHYGKDETNDRFCFRVFYLGR